MRTEPAQEGKFQWLARLGFVARGILYIVIGLLVLGAGRTEDLTGAMEYLGRGRGHWLLLAMTAGMAGYGTWRVADAIFGMDSGRGYAEATRRRIGAGASGIIYLFLAYKALRIATDGDAGGGGPQENAATAMHRPNGEYLVAAAAAVLAGAGLVQVHKAATCSFLRDLDDRARVLWAKWLGRIGYAARGVIFLVAGYLLARAAFDRSPAEAGGLEQALDALSPPLDYAVAAGLMLFGAYSLIEARYRAIHRPPVERVQREIEERVAPRSGSRSSP